MLPLLRRPLAAAAAACVLLPAWAQAQQPAYPNKPVRLVVPFAPGGPNDVLARVLAQKLSTDTGQSFVVENKAGAGGIIGTDAVAKAAPDGYVLCFISAPFTMSPALQADMPYDTERDLVAVTKVAESPMVMMVPSTSRFSTAQELIDYARKNPEKITYGSGGVGSTPHLTTEWLGALTGAKFLHVPYKGGGESIKALMAGEVDLLIDSITSTAGAFASGRIKGLGVGQAQRAPQLPSVPTFAEAGLKDFSVTHWVGVVAPAKTPAPVLAALHAEILKALKSDEVTKKFAEIGAHPVGDSPQAFGGFIHDELVRWKAVVKQAGIQPQ
ncbi:tripartite tricarboxylate transporter substrate binding protein [Pigmentiphaga soli]|uniref:Tripartite tricarboxylate transporter substrate binding protein n=1 Tax=Pigmentiphaga soli TaxID=1007095 RepID=A0ABP8H6A9_9BURK